MRSIAKIENHDEALLAGAHLVSNGVECKISQERDGLSLLWVLHEDQLPRSRELLSEFMNDPNKERYREAVEFARRLARQQEEQTEAADKRAQTAAELRYRLLHMHKAPAPVTWAVMGVCVFLWLLTAMNPGLLDPVHDWLFIATPGADTPFLQQVLEGQAWRLFTPAFLHAPLFSPAGNLQMMGIAHILFNMSFLKDLGGMLERREGGLKLLWLILLTAALSNLAQYYFAGPNFLGFSGVAFALAGYLWTRGKYDLAYGLRLNRGMLISLLIWLFFCMLIPGVANYAHAAGLHSGALIGFLCSDYIGRRLRRG